MACITKQVVLTKIVSEDFKLYFPTHVAVDIGNSHVSDHRGPGTGFCSFSMSYFKTFTLIKKPENH